MSIASIPSAPSKPIGNLGQLDTSNIRSSIMELDTNGDGKIGDSEFAAYRSQKQARGEFIPSETPTKMTPVSEKMQQAMFEALVVHSE
jgi:hypothetical protein